MCPSVRGADGVRVALLLGASGALTGGLVGLVAGSTWRMAGFERLGAVATGLLVVAAVTADLAATRSPRLRPLAVRRQVPEAWGRLFGPRLTATLYGARLGVGPLTILRTWTWWAALLVGASLGPWPSAAAGAAFALTRTLTMLLAGRGASSGLVMRDRMAVLIGAEAAVRAGTTGLLVVTAATLLLA